MAYLKVHPIHRLSGEVFSPADKSISHRAVIISCLAQGKTVIENFSLCEDCLYTVKAFKEMGIKIKIQNSKFKNKYQESPPSAEKIKSTVIIYGKGLYGLRKPRRSLFLGNSGTTMRILLGVLAGQDFQATLKGAASLSNRPMRRVTEPLRMMGAKINSKFKIQNSKIEEYAPLTIKGGNINPIRYKLSVPSAQVKSAVLLAGLYAKGVTEIKEPIRSRNHTELMLKKFGADIRIKRNGIIQIRGRQALASPGKIRIPGDISSAAFFIVAASILPGSRIIIKSVGLNPTRMGLIRVLKRMGADIKLKIQKSKFKHYEPTGDIIVKAAKLKATKIEPEDIPLLIDELPILMVAACFAKGKTQIKQAQELRLKETDRINSMSDNLKRMGADIQIKKDTIIIQGIRPLRGAKIDSHSDHRTAMSMTIAALAAKEKKTIIEGIECFKKSFPNFRELLSQVIIPKGELRKVN